MQNMSTPATGNNIYFNYDFRDPQHVVQDNGIAKSTKPDTIHHTFCVHCESYNNILVHTHNLAAWRQGEYVQDVFTWLDAEQREILQSGIHPMCWKEMFPSED